MDFTMEDNLHLQILIWLDLNCYIIFLNSTTLNNKATITKKGIVLIQFVSVLDVLNRIIRLCLIL